MRVSEPVRTELRRGIFWAPTLLLSDDREFQNRSRCQFGETSPCAHAVRNGSNKLCATVPTSSAQRFQQALRNGSNKLCATVPTSSAQRSQQALRDGPNTLCALGARTWLRYAPAPWFLRLLLRRRSCRRHHSGTRCRRQVAHLTARRTNFTENYRGAHGLRAGVATPFRTVISEIN